MTSEDRPEPDGFDPEGGCVMKWDSRIDYHGSRLYGSDEAAAGPLRLLTAWLAKLFPGTLGSRRRGPSSTELLQEGEARFAHAKTRTLPPNTTPFDNDYRVFP